MAEGTEPGGVHNVVHGGVPGAVVQAGAVHGGVHIHQPAPVGALAVAPRQGPAPPAQFVGREAELAALDAIWDRHGERFGLVLITGPAGVGKSALAAKWAAQTDGRFPDGHVYAELGAYDPAGPSQPGEVLGGFLRALGLPYDQVPAQVAEQAALFRSVTASKRLLLLLDNAATAAQVRQLLPGGRECMVVVTARSRLSGLVSDGARIVTLEPLPADAGAAFLRAAIGDARVDDDAVATAELIRHCAGLPLALNLTAARLVTRPRWPVRRIVTELAAEDKRLEVLSTPDGESVAAALDLSYRTLSETAARCYRALGVHAGRRPTTAVITAALDLPPRHVSGGLDELVEANLADDSTEDRYYMHDLALLHARQQAQDDPDRDRLISRIAEWYLAGTRAADQLLTPYRRRPPAQSVRLPSPSAGLQNREEALDWLERERANLVATVVTTAGPAPELAWWIAYDMWPLFHYRRHYYDRLTVDRVAVVCARQLGNRDFEARMLRRLGFAHFDIGQWAEATSLFRTSLELCQEIGDQHGVAAAVEGLGMTALARRDLAEAGELFSRQLAMYEALGEPRRAALATLNLGIVDNASGRPAQAMHLLARASASLASLDPYNHARARLELGKALTAGGSHTAAATELWEALSDMRHLGSPRGEAQAHQALAMLAMAGNHSIDARDHLEQALRIYERLGDPEAAEVRRLVHQVPSANAHPDRVA